MNKHHQFCTLCYLEKVRLGILSPIWFKRNQCTYHIKHLTLSKYQKVTQVYRSTINCMDLEQHGWRYDQPYAHNNSIECVQWFPHDTGLFITSGTDCQLKIWDTTIMKPAEIFHLEGISTQHHMSSKHNLIAVANSKQHINLIDLKSGAHIQELRGHIQSVLCCQWSPRDDYILASGGMDKKVLLWDIRSAKSCLASLSKDVKQNSHNHHKAKAHGGCVNCLKFTSDGLNLISFGTDSRIYSWSIPRGYYQLINFGPIHNSYPRCLQMTIAENSIYPILFVPSDENIKCYNLKNGMQLCVLRAHFQNVRCCVFNELFLQLYSGGADRLLLSWAYEQHMFDKSGINLKSI